MPSLDRQARVFATRCRCVVAAARRSRRRAARRRREQRSCTLHGASVYGPRRRGPSWLSFAAVPDADERLESYARLAVQVGLNLQPGQMLGDQRADRARAVRARDRARRHTPPARSYVDVLYTDQHVRRAHIEQRRRGAARLLAAVARRAAARARRDRRRALRDHRQPRAGAVRRSRRRARRQGAHARGRRGVAEADRRALQLDDRRLPERGLGADRFRRARRRAALGGGRHRRSGSTQPDPVAAWRDHIARLQAARGGAERAPLRPPALPRARHRPDDRPASRRATGRRRSTSPNGIEHVANMPTEEVFTTPDARRVEGTVRSTLPLQIQGNIVRGLEVRFEGGRAVEVRAEIGRGRDAHARRDRRRRRAARRGRARRRPLRASAQTGLVFYDTLFDENASSHIALGASIVQAVPWAAGRSRRRSGTSAA